MKWFDIKDIYKAVPDAHIYMVFGERSNGKTYSTLQSCVEDYVESDKRFVYVRRLAEMVRMTYMRNLFNGNRKTGALQLELKKRGFEDIGYYSSAFWAMVRDEKHKLIRIDEPCGYTSAISTWETSKGASIPHVGTILFDEFLTRGAYLPDEPVMFENLISSIVREESGVKVVMLANTVSWTAPYFREWGLNHVREMAQGDIQTYVSGDNKRKIAVCYAEHAGAKASDVYFNYDNPRSRMITSGVWETAEYPRIPTQVGDWVKGIPCYVQSIDEWTIKLMPAMTEDGMEVLLVYDNGRKLIDENGMDTRYRDRIIYTDMFYPYLNCKFCITKHNDPYTKFILNALKQGRVFYQNNTVGEYLRSYLMFSTKYTPIPN